MAGLEKLPSRGVEDLIVGELALYKFNAPYMASHRLCIDCSRIPLSVNNTVSAHWCSPGKLREIHKLYQQTEVAVYSAKHPAWSDEVYFFANGFFVRKTSGCSGIWHEDKENILHLKWSAWAEETLKRTEHGYSNGKFLLLRQGLLQPASESDSSVSRKFPERKTIPKIIHQFVSDETQVPELQRRCLGEWKDFAEKHGFEYHLWTPEKIGSLIEKESRSDWVELIAGSKDYGQYGDLCRFMLLYALGGWWVDWDISIIHPGALSRFLDYPYEKVVVPKEAYHCIEFIGAPPHDETINDFLAHLYTRRNNRGNTVEYSGPLGFTRFIDGSAKYDETLDVFPLSAILQAGFNAVKSGALPMSEAKQPLFHYWGHIWICKQVESEHLALKNTAAGKKLINAAHNGNTAKQRFLIAICSAAKHVERRQACRDTWLTRLPANVAAFFFVGKSDIILNEDDVVLLDVPDDYDHLAQKVREMFSHALREYDFEYLVKCDDDTYLVPERLPELVNGTKSVIGYVWDNGNKFLSGGAGYIIRSNCLAAISGAMSPREACEDVAVTKAARSLGLAVSHTDRLQYGHGRFPRENNNKVSSHWCKPDEMRRIHERFFLSAKEVAREELKKTAGQRIKLQPPVFSLDVYHACWNDTLRFYENGLFARTRTSCRGLWQKDEQGIITLDWFDWGTEYLYPDCDDPDNYAFFIREDRKAGDVIGEKCEVLDKRPASWGVCAVAIPRESYYWLKDWIRHHVDAGASRVVIYDNTGSTGSTRPLTAFASGKLQQEQKSKRGEAYGKLTAHVTDGQIRQELEEIAASFEGKVEIITWQPRHPETGVIIHGQVEAYCDFIRRHRKQLGWGAFLDLDEYLYCAPGLAVSGIIQQVESELPNVSVIQIRPWRFESRWNDSGPNEISGLTKHTLIDGATTSKSFVRLQDVTHANIHLQWEIQEGCFRVFAVPGDFAFCHYNQKFGTMKGELQEIHPREFIHASVVDKKRMRVLAPFPSIEHVEPLSVENATV
jgi:hypothetical protein